MADLTDLYTAPTSHEAGLDSEKMLLFSLQVTVEVGQITILHSSILEEMTQIIHIICVALATESFPLPHFGSLLRRLTDTLIACHRDSVANTRVWITTLATLNLTIEMKMCHFPGVSSPPAGKGKKKTHFESVQHGPISSLKHTLLFSFSAAASAQAIFKVELISFLTPTPHHFLGGGGNWSRAETFLCMHVC